MTDLRDVTLYEDEHGTFFMAAESGPGDEPVPAVVGITVKQVMFERRVTDKMRRERDEARAEAEKLRETLASVGVPLEALRLANRDVPGWVVTGGGRWRGLMGWGLAGCWIVATRRRTDDDEGAGRPDRAGGGVSWRVTRGWRGWRGQR